MAARSAEVALRTVSGYSADRCGIAAAGITYFALISIFPMALVALSVAGFVFSSEADQQRLVNSIMDNLPIDEAGGRQDLQDVIDTVVDARGTIGIIGILSAIYTGSSLFTAVRVALNGVFHGEKTRPFILGKLVDIGMLVGFGGLLLISTASSFTLAFIGSLARDIIGDDLAFFTQFGLAAASLAVALVLSTVLFLVLYTRVPARKVPWKYALPGAILAAVLFEALKLGFAQYAANFGNYNATYGSLGFVLLLLAFIYFTSQVTLLGAEAARASSEVATGWPFPAQESRLHALRERLASVRNKVAGFLRRNNDDEPTEPNPATATTASLLRDIVLPTVSPAQALAVPARDTPPQPRRRTPLTAWLAAFGVVGGLLVAALARAKRRPGS